MSSENASTTTITILEAQLLLVHIPRSKLQLLMSPILDCWWFRGAKDPFFALCVNGVEVSLFADAGIVKRTFGEHVGSEEELEEDEPQDGGEMLADEEGAGESAITLGAPAAASRGVKRRRQVSTEDPDETVRVGADIWMALEIMFHGDGWEKAGGRVRELSRPLADEGISILFLSTYASDYILVKSDQLSDVTAILEKSGFAFSPSDEDDDVSSPQDYDPSHSKRSRGISISTYGSEDSRRRQSHGGGSMSGSMSGSLSGSLIMSEKGSVGSSPARREGGTMSRSGSINKYRSSATRDNSTPSSNHSPSEPLPTSPLSPNLSTSTVPLSPPESAPSSPPPTDLDTQLPTTPSHPAPAFTPGNSLTILPDELVCIGLDSDHEEMWKSKIVQAIFFPERVLPPTRKQKNQVPSRHSLSPVTNRTKPSSFSSSAVATGKLAASGISTTSQISTPRPHSLSNSLNLSSIAPLTSPDSSRSSSSYPSSSASEASGSHPTAPNMAASVATHRSGYPTPFIAFTQTVEGTSLTADVRLLRAVFKESEESEMVYAFGNGGLRGIWQGEDEDEEVGDLFGTDAEDVEALRMRMEDLVKKKNRGRPLRRDSNGESVAEEVDEWETVEREDQEREVREKLDRKEKAKEAGEEGRMLLKCLQLDLVAFGLDKPGIVEHFAGLLCSGGVNLLYQSTYQSANILVAKSDIARARKILEEQGRIPV